MLKRKKYLKEIRNFYDDDLIKVITGIRRCGKSVLLSQIRDEIAEKTDNILYLDFEDSRYRTLTSSDTLIEYVETQRKPGLMYVFLDEVQRVSGWAEACRTLRLRNCSVFVSGSNAKVLSSEFTLELSGRYISFQIRPMVFSEIREYLQELGREADVTDYLIWGGFPKRLAYTSETEIRHYLNDLFETIVITDSIARYKIKKPELFRRLATYVFQSNSRVFSARSIEKTIKSSGWECSIATIIKYIGFLESTYAISSIKQYSQKKQHEFQYYQKLYLADVAFNSLFCTENHYDLTHNLENIVYNELKYRGYDVNVGRINGYEIDFIAYKNERKLFIQVAYSVADEKAYEREFRPFEYISNLYRKILITADEANYSTDTVEHIRFRDFLTQPDL